MLELPRWLPYQLGGAVVVLTALVFYLARSRRAVAALVFPLAVCPIAASWFFAVHQVIQGFRQMALTGSGGVKVVVTTLLVAIDTVRGGIWMSFAAFVVALVLTAVAAMMDRGPSAAAPPVKRSWVVIATSAVAMLLVVVTMQTGWRCLVLPLPVVTLDMEVDPERTSHTARARASFDFDPEGPGGMGAVSHYIARAMTTAATVSFFTVALSGGGFVLGWVLALATPLSRSAARAGLVLTGAAMVASLVQLAQLGSLAEELDYIQGLPPSAPQEEGETVAPEPSESTLLEGVSPPRKVHDVAPIYPADARNAGIAGQVVLEAMIDVEGNVTSVSVVESIPELDEAAIHAVRQWKYEPTLYQGVPVPLVMTVTVTFELN